MIIGRSSRTAFKHDSRDALSSIPFALVHHSSLRLSGIRIMHRRVPEELTDGQLTACGGAGIMRAPGLAGHHSVTVRARPGRTGTAPPRSPSWASQGLYPALTVRRSGLPGALRPARLSGLRALAPGLLAVLRRMAPPGSMALGTVRASRDPRSGPAYRTYPQPWLAPARPPARIGGLPIQRGADG